LRRFFARDPALRAGGRSTTTPHLRFPIAIRPAGRKRLAAALFAALLLLPAACSNASGSDTVRIYSSIPLQGPTAADYQTIVDSIRMALADRQNRAGRFKIEYISLDDAAKQTGKWDASHEQANARRAAADPAAVAYIGTVNSGAAKVSIPILNRAQLAMISPANTYPGLTKTDAALSGEPYIYSPLGPDSRNYCRDVTTDDIQGSAGALYAKQQLNAKSVYVFDDTELYGHGIAQIFVNKAKEQGLNVLGGPVGLDPRRPEAFSQPAQQAVQAKPDLVYFGGTTETHGAELLKALRAAGFQGVFMGPDGIVEPAFAQAAGSGAGRVVGTLVGLPPSALTGKGADWYRKFKAQHNNQEPSPYAPYAYDATIAVLDAIARAGTNNRTDVLRELKKTQNLQGITGTWSLDGNCDTNQTTISINTLQNGTFNYSGAAPQQ
jgi:branched-chain amino acid transport system substrate-binding protein